MKRLSELSIARVRDDVKKLEKEAGLALLTFFCSSKHHIY
jgi:hypothetical protein